MSLTVHKLLGAGHLTTLNLDSWNLVCTFPGAEVAAFQDLETLSIATNSRLEVRIHSHHPLPFPTPPQSSFADHLNVCITAAQDPTAVDAPSGGAV